MGAEFGMAFSRPDFQGAFASVLLPMAFVMMGLGLMEPGCGLQIYQHVWEC